MKLKNLRMTCSACPSQWEAETADGLQVYVRYRWGCLTWGMGKTLDEAVDAAIADPGQQLGHELDGDMGTGEMLIALGAEQ